LNLDFGLKEPRSKKQEANMPPASGFWASGFSILDSFAMTRILFSYLVVAAVSVMLPVSSWAAALDRTVRIRVFGLFHPTELVVTAPSYEALVVRAGNQSITLESRQRAKLTALEGTVRCVAPAGTLVGPRLQVLGRDNNVLQLVVRGKLERRFQGGLEVVARDSELVAIVTMDLEVAVASVVAAESLPGTPLEALKAQAVAARSYYAAAQRHTGGGFDFCDTTHCQFIREVHGLPTGTRTGGPDPAAQAAVETRGMILTYRGAKLPALYSASCGGRTRSLAEAGLPAQNYPYYAVDCPYCQHHSRAWGTRLRLDQAALLLAGNFERSRLLTARKLGWSRVPGNNYQVRLEGATAVLQGHGAGHGVGLCQAGAAALASAGWDFRALLAYYYPNTTLVSDFGF
jgi:stage II sporulation protein D